MCAEVYLNVLDLRQAKFLVRGSVLIIYQGFGKLLAIWLFVVVCRTLTGDDTHAGLSVAC